jgi:excisionase family DNA binding protein
VGSEFISTAEAGRRLGVTARTIRTWIGERRLRGEKIGNSVVVEMASVAAMERQQRNHRPAHVRDWR